MYDTETETQTNLPDVPSFGASVAKRKEVEPWVDGWYEGQFLASRTVEKNDGSEITFQSEDTVSQKGDSRNIAIQTTLTRKSDGREFTGSTRINYRPAVDFTPERLAAISAANEAGERLKGDMVRSQIAINQLQELEQVAGGPFSRTESGGLNITPVFTKRAYFRLADETNKQTGKTYKGIVEFRATPPTRKPVL